MKKKLIKPNKEGKVKGVTLYEGEAAGNSCGWGCFSNGVGNDCGNNCGGGCK